MTSSAANAPAAPARAVNQPLPLAALSWLLRHSDLLLALLLVAFIALYYWGTPLPVIAGNINYHDSSWSLDIIQKARQGTWLGRDYFFTYGPLLQWLLERFCSVKGLSFGSFTLGLWVFQWWSVIGALYATGALLLARQPGWKRAFCFLLLLIFWAPSTPYPFELKLFAHMAAFAFDLCAFSGEQLSWFATLWRGIAVSAITFACMLISADAGVYALISLVVVAALSAVRERSNSASFARVGRIAAVAFAFLLAEVLAANAWFGGIFDFRFWRVSLAIVQSYRWSEPWSLLPSETHGLVAALAVFAAILIWRGFQERDARSRFSLATIAVVALGMTQSCLVLSDPRHVGLSLFPLIAFSCYLLFGAASGERAPAAFPAVVVALALTAVFSGPNSIFEPQNMRAAFISQPVGQCPAGLALLDQACVTQPDFYRMSAISDYLEQNSAPDSIVGVFPHQNIYGFFAHRPVAGAFSGSYVAVGDYLNSIDLAAWRRQQPQLVVYSADWEGAARVGGIPNFTRNPRLWLYLQQWYVKDEILQPRIFGLRRSPARAATWHMEARPRKIRPAVSLVRRETQTAWYISQLDVASKADADFLRLQVRVNYPLWWKILKPSYLFVDVQYADGSTKEQLALAEPNRESEIWIYPWSDSTLPNYFEKDPSLWRDGDEKPITALSIRLQQMDWVSVVPRSIQVSGFELVRVSLK